MTKRAEKEGRAPPPAGVPPALGRRWADRPWRRRTLLCAVAALIALAYGLLASDGLTALLARTAPSTVYYLALPAADARAARADRLRGLSLDAAGADRLFGALDYDLEAVRNGRRRAPPLFLAALPADLDQLDSPAHRKRLFLKAVLPLVLEANREIRADRARLEGILARQAAGAVLDADYAQWLEGLAAQYGVDPGDARALLDRVDEVPPSLALAQAAVESGWGTSRFVREGNALFGQWTFDPGQGMTPRDRTAHKRHMVRRFNALMDSVRAYMRNLNTHQAYREFRAARRTMRADGSFLRGRLLAAELSRYSERGRAYVADLRSIIRENGLSRLDAVRLDTRPKALTIALQSAAVPSAGTTGKQSDTGG